MVDGASGSAPGSGVRDGEGAGVRDVDGADVVVPADVAGRSGSAEGSSAQATAALMVATTTTTRQPRGNREVGLVTVSIAALRRG